MTTTPPILDEFRAQLAAVRTKSKFVKPDKIICLASTKVYEELCRNRDGTFVVYDQPYHFSPLRVLCCSVIRVDHLKRNFTFAVTL